MSLTIRVVDTVLPQYGPDEAQKKYAIIRVVALLQGAYWSDRFQVTGRKAGMQGAATP